MKNFRAVIRFKRGNELTSITIDNNSYNSKKSFEHDLRVNYENIKSIVIINLSK